MIIYVSYSAAIYTAGISGAIYDWQHIVTRYPKIYLRPEPDQNNKSPGDLISFVSWCASDIDQFGTGLGSYWPAPSSWQGIVETDMHYGYWQSHEEYKLYNCDEHYTHTSKASSTSVTHISTEYAIQPYDRWHEILFCFTRYNKTSSLSHLHIYNEIKTICTARL